MRHVGIFKCCVSCFSCVFRCYFSIIYCLYPVIASYFLWILPDIFVFYKPIFTLKWAFWVSKEVIFLCLYASFMWIFMNYNSCFQRIIALFYRQNIVFIAIFPA